MWVSPDSPAGPAGLKLEPGSWRLTLDRAGAPVEARVRAAAAQPFLAQGGDTLGFDLDAGVHAVTIEVTTARPEGALVLAAELRRLRGE